MKYESLQQNNFYHIFNQGNSGEDIFIETENYDYFLKLLIKYIVPVTSVFSYCLMRNHFHLLVRIENEEKVSKSFSNFFNAYAKSINKKYNRTGSLFRDRFKRIKIKDENYLKQLVIYINLNPVYHQFVEDVSEYKYSSYRALLSDKKTLLKRNYILNLFDGKDNFKHILYHKKLDFDEKMKELILE